ncbi:hypothetical protein Tco_0536430 [Tanacetum coccineum]
MAALVITISFVVSEESLGFVVSRVILFATIPLEIPIVPDIPTDLPSTPELPAVSPFVCSDDFEFEPADELPKRYVSLRLYDDVVSWWRDRVRFCPSSPSGSSSPDTTIPSAEIPVAPTPPALISSNNVMDDPNITMEEYIQLMANKARGRDQTFNWETTTYGKVYCEDLDSFIDFETDFPAIVYNDASASNQNVSSEPTVSIYNAIKSDIDFHISFSDSEDEDYTFIYNKDSSSYKLIPANNLKPEPVNDYVEINIESCSENIVVKPMDSVVCISKDTTPIEFDENFETNHDIHRLHTAIAEVVDEIVAASFVIYSVYLIVIVDQEWYQSSSCSELGRLFSKPGLQLFSKICHGSFTDCPISARIVPDPLEALCGIFDYIVMENPNHLNKPNEVIPKVNPVVPEPNQVVNIHDPNEMVDIPDDIDLVDYDEEDPEEEPRDVDMS